MNISDEFKKPFNIVSLSITVLAILISILMVFLTQDKKKLVYIVSKDNSKIYDQKLGDQSIIVLSPDSVKITTDVYVTSITMWNHGNVGIEPEDIRKPIKIIFKDGIKIINYRIVNTSDDEIIGLNTKIDSLGKMLIQWKHLEPKFGFEIQLIYSGCSDPISSVEGYVGKFGVPIDGRSLSNKYKWLKYATIILAAVCGFLTNIIISVGLNLFSKRNRRKIKKTNTILMLILFIILIVLTIIISKGYSPPI